MFLIIMNELNLKIMNRILIAIFLIFSFFSSSGFANWGKEWMEKELVPFVSI
jgi:hypothetical protein